MLHFYFSGNKVFVFGDVEVRRCCRTLLQKGCANPVRDFFKFIDTRRYDMKIMRIWATGVIFSLFVLGTTCAFAGTVPQNKAELSAKLQELWHSATTITEMRIKQGRANKPWPAPPADFASCKKNYGNWSQGGGFCREVEVDWNIYTEWYEVVFDDHEDHFIWIFSGKSGGGKSSFAWTPYKRR